MSDKLKAHGFSKIFTASPMMSINLHDLPERKEIPGLEIKPVRSEEEMKIFDKVLKTQFPLDEAMFKKIHEIECSYGLTRTVLGSSTLLTRMGFLFQPTL